MKRTIKVGVVAASVAVTSLVLVVHVWFHGYFDSGKFEIKQAQWSPSKQVAMVAERSDKEALGGLEFYVLVGDHLFTPAELRHAHHSNAVILRSPCNCVTLHWEGPNRLTIKYDGSYPLLKDLITVQRQQIGNIAISYEDIAAR
jgi:hypothetical protein